MRRIFKQINYFAVLLILIAAVPSVPFAQQGNRPQIENLAFKILQKQAAEYELALSELLSGKIAKYIPQNRFHLSVRIFWNPSELDKIKAEHAQLKNKSEKLPGFPIFVKAQERGLDYYMGAGSVMKLKIDVLIDEKLPKPYTDFIYQVIPIQARFVPDRGDSMQITAIPFPETATAEPIKRHDGKDIPLTADAASLAVTDSIRKGQQELDNIKPVILNPVLQRYVSDYEKHINAKLTRLLSEYVEKRNFLLNVKFYWNPDEINKLRRLVVQADPEGKIKLPGFNVYVEERDTLYETISSSATLMRMEVSIMLDEAVSPEVEPFLKKLMPMTIRLMPERGDKLVVFRGHFPRLKERLQQIVAKTSDRILQSEAAMNNEIEMTFQNGDYRRTIVLVDLQLAKVTSAYSRLPLLKKKGTLHLLLQEKELARAAWEQVKRIDPDDKETAKLLEHIR